MNDLISRQVAIDDLHGKDPSQIWDTADIEVWVNALPSAQPERKKGKWINNIHDLPICDQCGYMTPYDRAIDDYEYGNFCPNCGADMRGDI